MLTENRRPVVLEITTAQPLADGVTFYEANRTFWLVDALGPQYLRVQYDE